MTRFAAYSSDSGTDEEEEKVQQTVPQQQRRPPTPSDSEEGEEDSGEETPSDDEDYDSDEEEIEPLPSRRRKSGSRDRNALVADENGDFRYAHEVERRASSSSPPPQALSGLAQGPREAGDSTVIPWARQVGVDAQKMHVMQASLFRNPEEAAALRALNASEKTKGSHIRLDFEKSRGTSRKHRRDSDGDGLRYDSRERASFGHDIDSPTFRPSRKYARVDIQSSVAHESEGAYSDAGLALGRSFRVGWGPGGQLVHLGCLCNPFSSSNISSNSSVLTLTKTLPSLKRERESSNTTPGVGPSLCGKLLQHHLSHTPISRDDSGAPFASPQSLPESGTTGSSELLYFASFISLFPATDPSGAASVFKLGNALFDPMDLRLNRSKATTITPDVRNRIALLRRKAALSKWLEDVVRPSVDGDLRLEANNASVQYTAADAAFTHLTGHQVVEACSKAADGGYLKLATLISQAGGDAQFKADLKTQLDIWRADKLHPGGSASISSSRDGLIGRAVWRIYSLLAGALDQVDEKLRAEDDVCAGLDWKRVFGLCLWYGSDLDASIADVAKQYEGLLLRTSRGPSSMVAKPISQWAAQDSTKQHNSSSPSGPSRLGLLLPPPSTVSPTDSLPEDPLYALIRLFADPALSLSKALNPLSYARSPVDVGIAMCWHLYIILSRVLQIRDFVDRSTPPAAPRAKPVNKPRTSLANARQGSVASSSAQEDDGSRPQGRSPTADLLASSYAFELETWGMLQEAVFVLLHLEDEAGRIKSIKDLLARSAAKLDEWVVHGLAGSLKLPMTWIDEAKAMYEFDCGNVYAAYELYISAQSYDAAHQIAVLDLAPDAVIRKDHELLRNLLAPFDMSGRREKIDGWSVRGKILLDYAHIMTRLPQLLDSAALDAEQEAIPDGAVSEEIDELTKRVPKIVAILPDILHRPRSVDKRHPAALEDISKELLKLVERARPLTLAVIQKSAAGVLDGASKIDLIKGMGYARFLESLED